MTGQLPEAALDVPRVVFAQRVIDKILRGALLYPGMETGEALIGLVVSQAGRAEPDIYVLDTIGPGEHAVREWGMFEQGDDWQGDVLHWLHVNWEAFRELRRPSYGNALAAKWDAPLMHVGDWHKQPGDMIAPSGGDAETARRMIADSETPVHYLIAPIVTMYPLTPEAAASPLANPEPVVPVEAQTVSPAADSAQAETDAGVGATGTEDMEPEVGVPSVPATADVVVEDVPEAPKLGVMPEQFPNTIVRTLDDKGWIIRVDCWYMSKNIRRFVAVAPAIWPDAKLPSMPQIAWHLQHPRRFDQEYNLLTDAGYMVDVVRWDADGRPPYEICFSVYKRGNERVILLVTPADYPAQMPAIRLAPLVSVADDEDVFEKLYEASEPVLMKDLPEWQWDSKRTLIELVWHVEKLFAQDGGET